MELESCQSKSHPEPIKNTQSLCCNVIYFKSSHFHLVKPTSSYLLVQDSIKRQEIVTLISLLMSIHQFLPQHISFSIILLWIPYNCKLVCLTQVNVDNTANNQTHYHFDSTIILANTSMKIQIHFLHISFQNVSL